MAKLCDKHLEPYTLYCNDEGCKRPICAVCSEEHKTHELMNADAFADYLNVVIEDEMQSYDQVRTLAQTFSDQLLNAPESLIQKTLKRMRRVQDAVASFQAVLSTHMKAFETRASELAKLQRQAQGAVQRIREEWEERKRQYKEMAQTIDRSRFDGTFRELYKIWLLLTDQTSMEIHEPWRILKQELTGLMLAPDAPDTGGAELGDIVGTFAELQKRLSDWKWANG